MGNNERIRKIVNKISLVAFILSVVFLLLGFGKATMIDKSIPDLKQKADSYCKNFSGVKTAEESLFGGVILCNKIAGERSYLFWKWNTYEGTRIEKDGEIIKDKIIVYMQWGIAFIIISSFIISITQDQEKEKEGLKT